MTIQILKSKIKNIKVTRGTIDYDGTICLPLDLMEAANIKEHEQVEVINSVNGNRQCLFVKESDSVIVPFTLAGVGHTISIMSTVTVPLDEPFNDPIIKDYSKE